MRRIVSIVLVFVLSIVFFASCAEDKNPDPVTDISSATDNKTIVPTESQIADETLPPQQTAETQKPVSGDYSETVHDNIIPEKIAIKKSDVAKSADFAVRLFEQSLQANDSEKNTLVSPLSVMCALAMTINGAEGETLRQMEDAVGMTKDDLNKFIYSYIESLPQTEKNKLGIANSIWFKNDDSLTVKQNFLETNKAYYDAEIREVPFDENTLGIINSWVNEKTDGMIPKVLDNINPDAVMYLINALVFDAEWFEPYTDSQVRSDTFMCEDGTRRNVEFMYGTEDKYIENSSVTGFLKYYKNNYAFVAMLPKEGISVSEVIGGLSGENLSELISEASYKTVHTSIPKFETEYSTEMSDILNQMGIVNAFDVNRADFSGIGTVTGKNIFINEIIHKTYISVSEKGARAGAVTSVELDAAATSPMNPKEVYLNRPFVYMIVDVANNLPVFMGTMMDVG